MIEIHNSDLIAEARDVLKAQVGKDSLPRVVAPNVQLVADINPKHARIGTIIRSGVLSNATTATIYTTPADQDFYLTDICFSFIKDATSQATLLSLKVTVNGAALDIISVATLSLTEQDGQFMIPLKNPVKVDRSTAIYSASNSAVANIRIGTSIIGFVDELSKA